MQPRLDNELMLCGIVFNKRDFKRMKSVAIEKERTPNLLVKYGWNEYHLDWGMTPVYIKKYQRGIKYFHDMDLLREFLKTITN